MKVIGLGAGRTGTDSLKQALIELGFGPTYHMKELLFEEQGVSTSGHIAAWEAAATRKEGEPPLDFPSMLSQFNSGADEPMRAFPDEMLAAFPEAKFVLTVRPAAKWWSSIQSSICWFHAKDNLSFKVLLRLPFFPFTRIKEQKGMIDAVVKYKTSYGDARLSSWNDMCAPENRERAMAAFDRHVEHVKRTIPSEQLLVFEVGKNSYAELARFLGVEPPAGRDFPRVNSKREFQRLTYALSGAAVAVVLLPLLLLTCVVRHCCFPGAAGKNTRTKAKVEENKGD